jgi:hypothetical protein
VAVTAADVKERFPEFSSVPDSRISDFIAEAGRLVSIPQWGQTRADDGILYLTAHLLAFDASGGGLAGGAVQSRTVGDVSESYAVGDAFSGSVLGATAYGRHFLELQRRVFVTRCV